jgi:hypothetical protein
MCELENDFIEESIYCESQQLAWKLEKLITQETVTLTNGETLIRVGRINQLIKELECSI